MGNIGRREGGKKWERKDKGNEKEAGGGGGGGRGA